MVSKSPDKTGKKQDGRFKKGHSGNPNGRPKGSRNKRILAVEMMIDDESEAITRKAIELALEGDMTALRLCLERIVPPKKETPIVDFKLPQIKDIHDLPNAIIKVIEGVSSGRILPSQARLISEMLSNYAKTIEVIELDERINELEELINEQNK